MDTLRFLFTKYNFSIHSITSNDNQFDLDTEIDYESFGDKFKSKYQLASWFYITILMNWYDYDHILNQDINFIRQPNNVEEMLKLISIEPRCIDHDLTRHKRTKKYLSFITEIKNIGAKSNLTIRDPESEIINEFNSLHINLTNLQNKIQHFLTTSQTKRSQSQLESISE